MPVRKASLYPPALDGEGDAQGHGGEEIPWVLLEDTAYVADRRNATTAYTDTSSGAQIQVTLCFARPPRVSYVCVYHHASSKAKEEAIVYDPRVISTDANLVLLSIALGPLPDLYIYRPAGDGDGGPSLTLLERPPCGRFDTNKVGVLSWHTIRRDDNANDDSSGLPLLRANRAREDTPYMVAALCYADFGQPEGVGHQLYVYDSKQPGSWRTHTVSVDEQHSQKHGGQDGYILHRNCKVIAIGGKRGTMGFVDLWRGIMLCDLLLVKDNPRLGYIKLLPPLLPDGFIEGEYHGDARLYRDIAAVEDRIMYVEHDLHLEPCPTWWDDNHCLEDGWVAATWSRLITSPVDAPWEKHHEIDSSNMDISTPQFDLLPKVHDEQGRPFPPFKRLSISQPTLSLCAADATVYFMVKKDIEDGKAWVIAVDMPNNKLEAVFEFDAERSACLGYVYMQSGISKYVKGSSGTKDNRKRPGGLLVGASNRKQPGILKLIEMSAGGSEEKQQDLEMEEGMAEDGDNDMLLDLIPSE